MAQNLTEKAVAYTREFVHRFWNGDVGRVRELLAEDFTWIGAHEEQFCHDARLFESAVAAIGDAMPCAILLNEVYEPLFHTGSAYVVAGRYLSYTSPELSPKLAARRRLTMVWRKVGDDLKLAHCHASGPLATAQNEPLPADPAQKTRHYAAMMANRRGNCVPCKLRDVRGSVHLLRLFDISYLEASRQSTVVHCLTGTFRVRGGIAALADTLMGENGRGLVRVHRSYCVNAQYVEKIDGGGLTLMDGTRIPIASRRHAEVCEEIDRARKDEG